MATPTITAAQGGGEPHQEPLTSGLTAIAAHYAGWGWLVLRADDRLLLTTNERVSAVELPAAIGAEVQHYLAVRDARRTGDRAAGRAAPLAAAAADRVRG
jgi:hypothetical protein